MAYLNTQRDNGMAVEGTVDEIRAMKGSLLLIGVDAKGNMVTERP